MSAGEMRYGRCAICMFGRFVFACETARRGGVDCSCTAMIENFGCENRPKCIARSKAPTARSQTKQAKVIL
jgi:hypothetical protein